MYLLKYGQHAVNRMREPQYVQLGDHFSQGPFGVLGQPVCLVEHSLQAALEKVVALPQNDAKKYSLKE